MMFGMMIEKVLVLAISAGQKKQMKQKDPSRRGQHPKHQGCVWGKFTVASDLPKSVSFGVFATAKSYDTVIRFSNGAEDDDRKHDVHGMAIKLLGVSGDKLLADERDALTQDFILADFHVFFARNLRHLLQFAKAKKKKLEPEQLYKTHPAFRGFKHEPADSPLVARYWSQTPYKLGQSAVRYSVNPAAENAGVESDRTSPHFLRNAMVSRLAEGQPQARFDFFVQPAPDANRKWIDDPTKPWDEQASPPIKVATITIDAQQFDTVEQQKFCEDLAYTPWHTLADHEPLGQINRARRAVYKASSKLRHETTKAPIKEPTVADKP